MEVLGKMRPDSSAINLTIIQCWTWPVYTMCSCSDYGSRGVGLVEAKQPSVRSNLIFGEQNIAFNREPIEVFVHTAEVNSLVISD